MTIILSVLENFSNICDKRLSGLQIMIRRILYSSSDESDEEEYQRRRKVYTQRRNFEIENDFSFKEAFRLNKGQVEFVLNIIGPHLAFRNRKNYALTAKEQLLITLHWLGNGGQLHGVAAMHGVNKSTLCRTLHRVAHVITAVMLHNVIRWPDNMQNIPLLFYRKGGFPCVCGCVDGTLIPIDAPNVHEENYIDRHGKHSLNVMLICGPDYCFYAVNANWPGSVHDSRVLRNTAVCRRFEEGWRPFAGAVVLGDSAYGIKNWLIPPLRRNPENENEILFNRHHKRTRRLIEDSIGILKEKFPCLNHLRIQPQKAARLILTCCILHNIARTIDREDIIIPHHEENEDEIQQIQGDNNAPFDNAAGERVNQLLQFFNQL